MESSRRGTIGGIDALCFLRRASVPGTDATAGLVNIHCGREIPTRAGLRRTEPLYPVPAKRPGLLGICFLIARYGDAP